MKARLKKTPRLKLSDSESIAKATFSRDIEVGRKWLSSWEKGEIDENEVDAVLAHEMGHIIDFNKGIHSVFLRSAIIEASYFVLLLLAFCLLDIYQFSQIKGHSWIEYLVVFITWLIFLPWITRRSGIASQFEADRYACQLIGNQKMALSFARRIEQSLTTQPSKASIIETLNRLFCLITGPTLLERLCKINFEVAAVTIEIRQTAIEKGKENN